MGIHGPRPARTFRLESPDAAVLEISVLPPSGPAGSREVALAAFLRVLFEGAVVLSAHPRTIISIAVHLQADEGSLTAAAVNATTLALVDAGVPLHGMVGACTVAALGSAGFVQPRGPAGVPKQEAPGGEEGPVCVLDASRVEERLPIADAPARRGATASAVGAGADGTGEEEEGGYDPSGGAAGLEAALRRAAPPATRQLHGLATVAHISTGVGQPALAPGGLSYAGHLPWPAVHGLVEEGRRGCATVLAFLHAVTREKVLRDAQTFAPELSVSVAQLGGVTIGPAPRTAEGEGEGDMEEEGAA